MNLIEGRPYTAGHEFGHLLLEERFDDIQNGHYEGPDSQINLMHGGTSAESVDGTKRLTQNMHEVSRQPSPGRQMLGMPTN